MMIESQIIVRRLLKAFSCYFYNIPQNMRDYQKQIFNKFNMHLNQQLSNVKHAAYLDNIMQTVDSDIYVFFDIDAIPLKEGIYEYIVNQIGDDNSIIGVEQAPNHINYKNVYAGPACFGITKIVYEKLGKPTFAGTAGRCDVGGEFTFAAKKRNINVKLFKIKSSYDKIWKCGQNKVFGHGTTYEDWIYHQFESPNIAYQFQFISKCKQILAK